MARKGRIDRGLVERPKGSNKWYVRLYDLGKEHWFGPHVNKSAARMFYELAKREQKEERFEPDRYHRRQRKITLQEWLDHSLENHTTKNQYHQHQIHYGRWWVKVLGRKRLDEITTGELERLQSRLLNKGNKAMSTINRYFAFLKHQYNLAIRDEKVQKNPVVGVKFFKETCGRLRFLTDGEEQRLKEVMVSSEWYFVAFALNTGLRQAEQFCLRWECIDKDNKVLTIPRSKSGETRHVQLNEEALGILNGLSSWMTSPWVFPSKNSTTPLNAQNFYHRVFQPALKRAGIEGVVWHTLRHSFASRLVMAGVDLRTVQELMGHKNIEMTLRDSHLSPGHLHSAVELLVKNRPEQNVNRAC